MIQESIQNGGSAKTSETFCDVLENVTVDLMNRHVSFDFGAGGVQRFRVFFVVPGAVPYGRLYDMFEKIAHSHFSGDGDRQDECWNAYGTMWAHDKELHMCISRSGDEAFMVVYKGDPYALLGDTPWATPEVMQSPKFQSHDLYQVVLIAAPHDDDTVIAQIPDEPVPPIVERPVKERFADDGTVLNGFDYKLQVWVVDGVVQPCGHTPNVHRTGPCCNAGQWKGEKVGTIEGHEVREFWQEYLTGAVHRVYVPGRKRIGSVYEKDGRWVALNDHDSAWSNGVEELGVFNTMDHAMIAVYNRWVDDAKAVATAPSVEPGDDVSTA